MRLCLHVWRCMFHCELIDGFYVLRAVNIRICQVGESEWNKRETTESTERPSWEGNSRFNVWLVDDAHNRYEVIYWVLFDGYDAKRNFHIFLLLLLIKLLFIVPQCVKYGSVQANEYTWCNAHIISNKEKGREKNWRGQMKKAKSNWEKRNHNGFFSVCLWVCHKSTHVAMGKKSATNRLRVYTSMSSRWYRVEPIFN